MIVSFFESLKYVGHLFPIAFLRFYIGYYYLDLALARYQGDFLTHPRIAAMISEWLPSSQAPDWYKELLDSLVIPNWQFFAYLLVSVEFVVGISYLLGYLVRPSALVAALMAMAFFLLMTSPQADLYKVFFALHLTLAWLGAGRCLGMDYFFFKRRRGIWW